MKSNCTDNKNSMFFFFITNYLHHLSIPLTTTFLVHKSSEINKITFKIQMKSERKRKKLEIIFITPPPYFTQQITIEHLCITNESINCSYMLYYNRNVTFTRSRLIQVAESKQGEIEGGKFTRIDATLVNVATSLFDVNLFDVHFSNPNDSRVTVIKADVLSGACFSLFCHGATKWEKGAMVSRGRRELTRV